MSYHTDYSIFSVGGVCLVSCTLSLVMENFFYKNFEGD